MKSELEIYYFLCLLLLRASASLQPNGPNVCTKQQSFARRYRESSKKSINKQVSYKCWANQGQFWKFYKTCYKNQVTYQTVYRELYRVSYRKVFVCCLGWQQSGTSCTKAICSQGCVNGNCTKPDVCICLPGYQGNSCSKPCPVNRWGPGCTNTCQCNNNATCDMRNGFCSCAPGWIGSTCAESCPQGFFGIHCYRKCACQNGARCHHVTGSCICDPGWTGQYCESVCKADSYGDQCQHTCKCRSNATCDHVTGTCKCRPGYRGLFCERLCDSGYYGDGCKERCSCHGDKHCQPIDGNCTCEGKSCNGSKASNDKHTAAGMDLLLPIVLSVSVIVVLAAVLATCGAYRKCRSGSREPQEDPKYEVTVNAGCTDGTYGRSEVNDFVCHKPSYMELTHIAQSCDHPVYQGLIPRVQHDLKSRDIENDNAGHDRGMYQTLNADKSRIYQPLNKTIDNVANNVESPVRYGNLQKEKSRVDDSELYLTILPDHDVTGQSNVIYENRYTLPDSTTNSPVLYGNVLNGEGMINQENPHEYFTVLPDDKTLNQPTYEVLPAT